MSMINHLESTDYIQKKLFELQDVSYKEFHCKLMPTVSRDKVIGIPIPVLRKLAKELFGTREANDFLENIPHQYYEENNLHGFLLEKIKDYEILVGKINEFLPYVDNWATCDSMSPKIFKKHLPKLLDEIKNWIASDHTYTIRFGVKMLMTFYLDEEFKPEYLDMVVAIKSEEYYVKMMVAWFMATALAKQWEATVPYIQKKSMDTWIHNKTIQKAVESYRITPEQKLYLKTFKVKS